MMRARISATLVVAVLAAACTREARADERVSVCADAAERGQELRDAHKLVEARPQLVVCAQRECPSVVRESCTEWLAELGRRTPSIVAGAKDEESHDIAGLSVAMDGETLPGSVTSAALLVNPGTHVIRYVAAGYDPVEESVVMREGEPLRVLSVTLRRSGARPETAPVPTPARGLPVVPLALGAASVIALSVFGYSAIKGASDYQHLERDCSPRCSSTEIDGVRSTFLVADIALVVGIVTGGAAVTLWIFDRPKSPSRAGARR
ncbi:MAG: hypothetical protein JWM74_2996 [Myxococcaceae bacterium]|jgi:hypothetical protein|nr:hypothetical protein [Myxococcaceae bacterium]